MDLGNIQAGQSISTSAMRALDAAVKRQRPALGGVTQMTGVGGTAPVKDSDDWFLVEITAVSGTGAAATYAFVEQNVKPHATTGVEDRGSPRIADLTANPGRCALASHTFAVDDLALARRNVGGPEEWELLPIGAGGDDFWACLVSKTGSTCPVYEFRRITKTVAGCGWTVDDTEGDPEGPLYEVNAVDHPVNDPVTDDPDQFVVFRVRPGAGAFFVFAEPPRWEFIRTTATEPDAGTGYYPAFVLHFPTGGSDPGDAEEVWAWDLNTSP